MELRPIHFVWQLQAKMDCVPVLTYGLSAALMLMFYHQALRNSPLQMTISFFIVSSVLSGALAAVQCASETSRRAKSGSIVVPR